MCHQCLTSMAIAKISFKFKSLILWMIVTIKETNHCVSSSYVFYLHFLIRGRLLQSGGTDSTVNLWMASTSTGDELTSERSFLSLRQKFYHEFFFILLFILIIWSIFLFLAVWLNCQLGKLIRYLILTVTMKTVFTVTIVVSGILETLNFKLDLTILSCDRRPCLEFSWALDFCIFILWWEGNHLSHITYCSEKQ